MIVCVCVCVYVFGRVCMAVFVCGWVGVCVYVCVCVWLGVCVYMCLGVCVCLCLCLGMCVCERPLFHSMGEVTPELACIILPSTSYFDEKIDSVLFRMKTVCDLVPPNGLPII